MLAVKAERIERRAPWRAPEARGEIPAPIGLAHPRLRLLEAIDRLISASSLVPDQAVLDVRDFAWTAELREAWHAIRDEALATALASHAAPGQGRNYLLWEHGCQLHDNLRRCPETADIVERIPGLYNAGFSILSPGTHLPTRRGATKSLITCHLGLIIPRDGDARMRIEDRVLRWAEGETLVFDDTREHETWNATSGTRIVLVLQFRRPLRNPGRWVAGQFLRFVRRST
ncbi:MAG: aspartyl/asparaginyl beta-hydroxylase domain-containing protein [Sphingomonadales bacterium]|nr:MAG: aspartyl/asparaginyl beta-hydroxylase domain-containing protein [Sphingomonadales bacterium]